MRPESFERIKAKSVVTRVSTDRMSFDWSLNPYRGCQHACTYCYARKTHAYLELDPGEGFNRHILVKENAPERLREFLAKPGWSRQVVALGTATDPYQPAESRYGITRQLLEVFLEFRTPVSIVTKSPLVLRDLDLLRSLREAAGCKVSVTVTTLDGAVAAAVEPGAPSPEKRVAALQELRGAGIPAGLLLAPVMPGLNDGVSELTEVIRAASEAGALYIHAIPLRLESYTKAWFLDRLRETHPHLLPTYQRLFRRTYLPEAYVNRLGRRVEQIKKELDFRDHETAEDPVNNAGSSTSAPYQLSFSFPAESEGALPAPAQSSGNS